MTKSKIELRRQFKMAVFNPHQSKKAVGEDFSHVLKNVSFGYNYLIISFLTPILHPDRV